MKWAHLEVHNIMKKKSLLHLRIHVITTGLTNVSEMFTLTFLLFYYIFTIPSQWHYEGSGVS
jgi:hypothetical protein